MNPPINPWRTVLAVVGIVLMQHVAFLVATHHGWTLEAAQAYSSLCLWSTGAATALATAKAIEHLGDGGGVKGAVAALMTSAKPGDPAP